MTSAHLPDPGAPTPDAVTPEGVTPDAVTPSFVTHFARESARFVEVLASADSGTRVPTCPDWDADDLLWHLAEVQWWADEQSMGFIRRRQAHEALIHRVDAELTGGDRSPIDPALSTDGVDEVLRIMYGGQPPWGQFTPDPTRTVRIQTSDTDRSWLVTLGQFTGTDPDGNAHDEQDLRVAISDTGETAAATVRAAAVDLDCWLWHRPPVGQVERSGDPSVLERLGQTISPGID